MKHLPTHVLLDLADDYKVIKNVMNNRFRFQKESAKDKLLEIDTELLSRVPEGEFITVYDYIPDGDTADLNYWLQSKLEPVGFEPYVANED